MTTSCRSTGIHKCGQLLKFLHLHQYFKNLSLFVFHIYNGVICSMKWSHKRWTFVRLFFYVDVQKNAITCRSIFCGKRFHILFIDSHRFLLLVYFYLLSLKKTPTFHNFVKLAYSLANRFSNKSGLVQPANQFADCDFSRFVSVP